MLLHLINLTPFAAQRLIVPDAKGAETLLVVVKATFDLNTAPPSPAKEQVAIAMADKHAGAPETTGLAVASDIAVQKPATDVLLLGSAHGGGREQVDVTLRMGPINKTLRVTGDRTWGTFLGMAGASKPKPFQKIPLVYERSFGGTDKSNPEHAELSAMNPAGVGFRASKTKLPVEGTPLPNIERPDALLRRPGARVTPGGFGPIPAGWEPRSKLAGTYDDQWLKHVSPLLPDDLNPKFYQAAPEDQIFPGYIKGGEVVEVLNATPSGTLRFTVPMVPMKIETQIGLEDIQLEAHCDTLVVNTDTMQLVLVWRASRVVHGQLAEVRWIKVMQEAARA